MAMGTCPGRLILCFTLLLAFGGTVSVFAGQAPGQTRPPDAASPLFLRDRGPGIATSMFGTYVRRGELLVYPFYEYYRDKNLEYKPVELGVAGEEDFRGRYRAHEGLLFVAYGLRTSLAVEFEVAVIRAMLDKSPDDPSNLQARTKESGLGDVEGQLRWRWRPEDERRPELFSYFETVIPHQKEKPLIGTPGWELKFGTGLIRGYSWGTLTARGAIEYDQASTSKFDIGEYAVEYLKRLSSVWRVYVGLEGTQDEVSLFTEAQWHVHPNVFIRFNNGLGLTSKATDWAPELGILFTVPMR